MTRKLSRRTALTALGSGFLIYAFDPCARKWLTRAHADLGVPTPALDGELVTSGSALDEAGSDFGHIVSGAPLAVLRPGSFQDVATMVGFARTHQLTIAMRGNGHSNYGQGLAPGGIVVDSSYLEFLEACRPHRIYVGAGTLWRSVVEHTAAAGWTPPVLTDYLDLSVGGTLSMGGIGGATQRHGLQLDNVLRLVVVTGTGEIRECSPRENRNLFYTVLGGGGQCALILAAVLRLQRLQSQAYQANLYYDALPTFLADMERVMLEDRFDYLEGQVISLPEGGHRFMMETAVYHDANQPPNPEALFDDLQDDRPALEVNATTYLEWAARVDAQEAFLRSIGLWDVPHPWLNLFLPSSEVEGFMETALPELDSSGTGGGPVLFYPVRRFRIHAPLFRLPQESTCWSLSVLRFTVDPSLLSAQLQSNRTLYEAATAVGGTRYSIGAIPMSSTDWEAHYAHVWPQLQAAKAELDPDGVLTPSPGIF